VKPLARPRLEGRAWIDGDLIVYACERIDSLGLDQPSVRVALELAAVRTPDDAAAFVGRHGPLGDVAAIVNHGEDRIRGVSVLKRPITVRERVTDVLTEAQHLNALWRASRTAREGGAAARRTTVQLAGELSACATGVGLWIEPADNGFVRLRVLAPTLRGFCYLSMAQGLADRIPIGVCEECDAVFAIEDGRQRFCGGRCSTRARQRRFREKRLKG
jgi:hypothetical protein